MGRKKIKMKKIVDISSRQVTFSKRRQGLLKKARELAILCEVEVGVFVFSPAGRLHHYASSNIEDILYKFSLHLDDDQHPVSFQGENKNCVDLSSGVEDANHLRGIEELQQLEMKLEAILKHVTARKKGLLINPVPALQTEESQKVHKTGVTQSAEIRNCAQEILGPIIKTMNLEGTCFPYSQRTKNLSDQSEAINYPGKWSPPPPDVYKVNFAGANFREMKASGIGVIFRNWKGEFMAALARLLPEQMDENATSSMAAKCAIEFAVDYYFTHITLEGDTHNIIKILENSDEANPPASTDILLETKSCIKQLDRCIFSHVQKSGNVAAHMVAQYAINAKDEVVWLMKEPEFLADILLADAVHLNS